MIDAIVGAHLRSITKAVLYVVPGSSAPAHACRCFQVPATRLNPTRCMYLWAVASQRPADSQTAPKLQSAPPPAQFGPRPGGKTPQSWPALRGIPSSSPLAAGRRRRAPEGSRGLQRPRTRCASSPSPAGIAKCNCEPRSHRRFLTELNSTTKHVVSDSDFDLPPPLRPVVFSSSSSSWASLFHQTIGCRGQQPHCIAPTGGKGAAQAQKGTDPALCRHRRHRSAVIQPSPCAARMPRCCAPSSQLPILGPDPQCAVSPPAWSWSAHRSTPNGGRGQAYG